MREKLASIHSIGTVKYLAGKARDPQTCEQILALLNDSDPRVARNAAWVMTHFSLRLTRQLSNRQDQFINIIMQTPNSSLRRLMLNVVLRQGIEQDNIRTDFLDFCMGHMIMPEEPPGVQSLCMKLAFEQCRFYEELLQEYCSTLELITASYAISAVGLKKRMIRKAEKAIAAFHPKPKKKRRRKK